MLKVLLVDATPGGASALGHALQKVEGVHIAHTVDAPFELAKHIEQHRPDIVLIDTDSPSRDVLEQLAVVSTNAPRPVVMFTDDGDHDAIRASLRAGVSAYIVDGIAPERLAPIMRVAIERFEADQSLRAELEEAKSRLEERKLVERAKGILMKQRRTSEDEAFALLRSLAMQRGIRLAEAARQVIDIAQLLG